MLCAHLARSVMITTESILIALAVHVLPLAANARRDRDGLWSGWCKCCAELTLAV